MGKPSAELPDSLDPAPAESADKVDDLLAQMAGEEIDRLLSEADQPREPSRSRQPTPEVAEPPIDQQLDELFSGADSPATSQKTVPPQPVPPKAPQAVSPPPATTVPTPADDEVSKQLTDLFADEDPPAPAAAPEVAEAVVPSLEAEVIATPKQEAAAMPSTSDIGIGESLLPEVATSAAERAALEAPPSDEDQLKLQLGEEDQPRGSVFSAVYSKSVEWLNGPEEDSPDKFRDLVGKIALLTLFNATAVLVYVFLFRHRHH